ncbi:aldehyde dehydrogenase family protein [Compostimonas suwonensis]|uniref:Betaine-aldehyde dehydrogenase/2-formylbenzoate dehydrogenase n=1 Tax=Compostimonas suwonensis TaxID=1048394 RepID=A0A2M9BBP0_9MICO|nr:aldehyde dehydrogenase family protein [Compostimonas suwonensis]PJJ55359.1 betaine-aldehyde dehydrogenase/2-formylbenzoate dehydrogenase [Compostimonas suwonensis]
MNVIEAAQAGDLEWARTHDWKLLIGGELRDAAGGATYENESPLTRSTFCSVPDAQTSDVDDAVAAAKDAYRVWREVPVRERGAIVRDIGRVLREHREELAVLDAIDVGNTVSSMLGDADMGIGSLEYMADHAMSLGGEVIPAGSTHFNYTRYEPYGVTARIVAFNHPTLYATMKIAAPLVAGNALIFKPSDASPLTALWVGELIKDLLPKGLFSVVVSKGIETSRAIVRHPDIRRIGFIGSPATGMSIQRDAAEVAVKNISLELGGKNAVIVYPDMDLDVAADIVVRGMNFSGWQSQSCGSTTRLFAHDDIADELVAKVAAKVAELRIGSPFDPETAMGSMATRAQFDKALGYIEIATSEGATLVAGGTAVDDESGYFVRPTIFDHVSPTSRLATEEVFGPVLAAIRWHDEEEMIDQVNSLRYGLTGSVCSSDFWKAQRMVHRIESGHVWINDASTHFIGVPFGGFKDSGVGREESVEELLSYAQLKAVNVRL